MPDASPTKWHLGHTSWFFETFILDRELPGYRRFDPQYAILFNSYYNTVGPQHPRPERGLLTRPSLDEVRAYRGHVDRAVLGFLEGASTPSRPSLEVLRIGLHHEQQHQELLLTDVKHLFSRNPLHPAYRECPETPAGDVKPVGWHHYPEGLQWTGHTGDGFSFDNETPRHRVFVEAFEIASRQVTNAEFLAFIEAGGYDRAELWLSDGWTAVNSARLTVPLYWERHDGAWRTHTLSGLHTLRLDEPVCHVSYYEADAYARWAGARLPTEAEWEVASPGQGGGENFLEDGRLHPVPAPPADDGPAQLLGNLWEWTQSPYAAYPGYAPPDGALGEYNGKFMCNQMVLRGGSCATPRSHIRGTYRNFFPPDARWQFSGIRLARDAR
ncbi:MAG: ergothioneine biosynthesis protein EgtB, partial [Deltaproteobacteria bacterium]|nr:ergothioneine biosynthesis protein EgtB [Deltaproteobacteria bacterium]